MARSPQVFDAGSPGATVYSLWDPGHIINLFGSSVFTSVKWVPYSLPQQRFLWGLNEVASHCFTIIVRRSGRLIQPFTYLTTPGGSSLGVLSLLEGLRGGQIPKGGPGTMDWAPEAWREAVTSLLPPSGIKWECCTEGVCPSGQQWAVPQAHTGELEICGHQDQAPGEGQYVCSSSWLDRGSRCPTARRT